MSLERNQQSIMVFSCISSTVTPRFRSSYTANSRSSVACTAISHRASSVSAANLGRFRVSREISAPRTAFIRAISKVSADGHDLAGGLHLGAQVPLGVDELVKGPLGELHRHVVQSRLESGVGHPGDGVLISSKV